MLDSYRHPNAGRTTSTPVEATHGVARTDADAKKPRWGDKNCLCHEGLRMFQQKRYLEAAIFYRKAGNDMLAAWGHENNDIGNARRGEAASLAAAGRYVKAETLYKDAIRIYLTCANGQPSDQLQDTILDLADTYKNQGKNGEAQKLAKSSWELCALAKTNPQEAVKHFNSAISGWPF